jgi:hypothetical protein
MEPSSVGAGLTAFSKLVGALKGLATRRRPLVIAVERRIAEPWSVVIDKMPEADPLSGRQRDQREIHAWLLEQGAADFRETELRIEVHCRSESAVSITDLEVVAKRRDPNARVLVQYPTAGAIDRDVMLVDLDANTPIVVPAHTDESQQLVPSSSEPFFKQAVVHVTTQAPWSAILVARASASDCEWTLRLRGRVGKRVIGVEINDHGNPFRTVGMDPGLFAEYVNWAWYETPPGFVQVGPDGLPID